MVSDAEILANVQALLQRDTDPDDEGFVDFDLNADGVVDANKDAVYAYRAAVGLIEIVPVGHQPDTDPLMVRDRIDFLDSMDDDSDTVAKIADDAGPVLTKVNIDESGNIKLRFNESLRLTGTGGTLVGDFDNEDSDSKSFITELMVDGKSIDFDAEIDGNRRLITLTPAEAIFDASAVSITIDETKIEDAEANLLGTVMNKNVPVP